MSRPWWQGGGVAVAGDAVWWTVRCVLEHGGGSFEERVTLWRARDEAAAVVAAREDAELYAGMMSARVLDVAQAYPVIDDDLGVGSEVFSLMRESDLDAEAYVARFFVTGGERPADGELFGDDRFS